MGRMIAQEIMIANGCKWLQMVAYGLLWVMDFSEFELLNTRRSSQINNSQQVFLKNKHHLLTHSEFKLLNFESTKASCLLPKYRRGKLLLLNPRFIEGVDGPVGSTIAVPNPYAILSGMHIYIYKYKYHIYSTCLHLSLFAYYLQVCIHVYTHTFLRACVKRS